MARRAAAALHKGDSSARSFPAALHDIHSMVAAGHGAEYPSGATGWRLEKRYGEFWCNAEF